MAFVIVHLAKKQYVRWENQQIQLVTQKHLAKKFSEESTAQSFFNSQLRSFYKKDQNILESFQIMDESSCDFLLTVQEIIKIDELAQIKQEETQTIRNKSDETIVQKLPQEPPFTDYFELSFSDLKLVLLKIPQILEPLLDLNAQLDKALNDCLLEIKYRDKEMCDLIHKAEFSTPNAAEGYRIFKEIHDSRILRRKAKDVAVLLQFIQNSGFLDAVEKFNDAYAAYRYKLDNRRYQPRIRLDLFEKN